MSSISSRTIRPSATQLPASTTSNQLRPVGPAKLLGLVDPAEERRPSVKLRAARKKCIQAWREAVAEGQREDDLKVSAFLAVLTKRLHDLKSTIAGGKRRFTDLAVRQSSDRADGRKGASSRG